MAVTTIAVEAETITPFAYHSLMVQSGTATLPELIGDRALAFGLARTLGITAARVALPSKDYRGHLGAMPYRTSVFVTDSPRLLPPLARRLNLDAEAGLQKKNPGRRQEGKPQRFLLYAGSASGAGIPGGRVRSGRLRSFRRSEPG